MKVGSFAAVGLRYRFYMLRPPPSGFELGSAYRASAHFYKLDLSILELANLVGRIEMLNFLLDEGIDPPLPPRIIRLVV